MASEFETHLKETLSELSKHLAKESQSLGLKTELLIDAKFRLNAICWDKITEFLDLNSPDISDSFSQLRTLNTGLFEEFLRHYHFLAQKYEKDLQSVKESVRESKEGDLSVIKEKDEQIRD